MLGDQRILSMRKYANNADLGDFCWVYSCIIAKTVYCYCFKNTEFLQFLDVSTKYFLQSNSTVTNIVICNHLCTWKMLMCS